jgi:hypothetical protein
MEKEEADSRGRGGGGWPAVTRGEAKKEAEEGVRGWRRAEREKEGSRVWGRRMDRESSWFGRRGERNGKNPRNALPGGVLLILQLLLQQLLEPAQWT